MRKLSIGSFCIVMVVFLNATSFARASNQFDAHTLDFSGFNGRVTIERHGRKYITVLLKRGDAQALHISVSQSVLYVVYRPKPEEANRAITGTISQFNMGQNATQKIVIGNKEFSARKLQEMPELSIQAPTDVALVSTAFVGEAFIDAMSGPAELSVKEGRIRAKRLGPSRLAIKGAGEIELDEAMREVRMFIDGAGDITIRGGNVENVWADAKGAGNIKYTGGRIRQAFVTARGASSIKLDGVDRVLRGPIDGVSEVEINP